MKKTSFWSLLTMMMVVMLSMNVVSCSSDDDDNGGGGDPQLVGTWYSSYDAYQFNSDGTYRYGEKERSGIDWYESGRWNASNGVLTTTYTDEGETESVSMGYTISDDGKTLRTIPADSRYSGQVYTKQ